MKRITFLILLIPIFIFSQNKKNTFLVVYPSEIKISNELLNESVQYINYEKNRSRKSAGEKINDKLIKIQKENDSLKKENSALNEKINKNLNQSLINNNLHIV